MKKIMTILISLCLLLFSCKPQQDDAVELPAPPTAAFDVQTTTNPNKVKLVNKTPDAFLFKWDLGNGSKGDSSVVEAYYPFKGTYKVTLQAFNKGGFGTITKDIVIAQDDPSSCTGNMQLLTGCGQKTWKLDPKEGALKVGPDAALATVWWQNSTADVANRNCHFNDEYIFSSSGTFEYNNKGDFWADTDANGNVTPADLGIPPGCQPASAWSAKYKAWGSGTHRFTVNTTELSVIGTGAWIGLYKVGTGAEVTTPQASVTYKIKELTANKLVLLINFGVGFWQFTLIPSTTTVNTAGYTTPENYAGYEKLWNDEFNGTALDATTWTRETGGGGWGNNELQFYTDRTDNAFVGNGVLTIEAKQEVFGGRNYTSARLITKGKKEFTFGRVDIRAKLPKGKGIWPALWMLGKNIDQVKWPNCGEIDIMEVIGSIPNRVHGTVHYGPQGATSSTQKTGIYTLPSGDFSENFNVFSLIWTQDNIEILVNDISYFKTDRTAVGSIYPFNEPFFMLFNVAVGGNWPGSPDATTVFPQQMVVDYIRVFKKV